MCNRVATPRKDEVKGYFNKVAPSLRHLIQIDTFEPHFHVTAFTKPMLPFVGSDDPLHISVAMWKFIPGNAPAKLYDKYDTSNARGEEIFEKRTYKDSAVSKRGLVVLKGFYEGQEQPDKTSQPYFIYPKDGELLTLGCVYNDWNDPAGEPDMPLRTFSIITTAANTLMSEIHNKKKRMPLIVPPDLRDWWLSDLSRADLEKFYVPYPDGYLAAHKVTRNIYKRGYNADTPDAQARIPEQAGLF